jgi:hypothetical protein
MKFAVYATLMALSACSAAPEAGSSPAPTVSLDVPTLVGEDRATVDAALGKPVCNKVKSGLNCDYDANTSVLFAGGKAANFTLPPVNDLRVYGLKLGTPSFQNVGYVTRWQTVIDNKPAEISSFVDYVYVKTVSF